MEYIGYSTQRKIASAEILQNKFEDYLNSIRTKETITDEDGNSIIAVNGKPIQKYVYYKHPTQGDFCLYLGISKKTWWKYCNSKEYEDLHESAELIKTFLESYLEKASLNRQVNVQTALFSLTNHYGWSRKNEIEFGENAKETSQNIITALSPREKLEKMKELFAKLPQDLPEI